MNATTLDSLIAAALANRAGAPANSPGNDNGQSWRADYGPGKQSWSENVTARLDDRRSRGDNGSGSSGGKNRMDNSHRSIGKTLWSEVMSLCTGTKIFAVCLGLVTFIAVV